MLTVETLPSAVLLTHGRSHQRLSCDFLVHNRTEKAVTLTAIEVSAFDAHQKLVLRKSINTNGFAPSIATIPETTLDAYSSLLLFNPFDTFDRDMDIATLEFTFVYDGGLAGRSALFKRVVRPLSYTTKTDLRLPLVRRMMVYDGHDFYSHHRRLDFLHPVARQLGLEKNSARYALDLSLVDNEGALHRGQGEQREKWYGFGETVYAPGAGEVIALEAAVPDNQLDGTRVIQGGELSLSDGRTFAGNYLVIDHENGEYSLLAHLQQHSAVVEQGAYVEQGQPIAALGFSGSTGNWVHLHYELRNNGDVVHAEGLPAEFHNFKRIVGTRQKVVERGQIDTGDIVEPAQP